MQGKIKSVQGRRREVKKKETKQNKDKFSHEYFAHDQNLHCDDQGTSFPA